MLIFSYQNKELTVFNTSLSTLRNNWKQLRKDITAKKLSNIPGDLNYFFSDKQKKDILDVDSTIPVLSKEEAQARINKINSKKKDSKFNINDLNEKERKYTAEWLESTKGQVRTAESYMEANEKARKSIEMENKAIEAQGIAARAASVGVNLLITASHMLFMYLISTVIQKALDAWDKYIHKLDYAKQKLAESKEGYETITSEIADLNEQLEANNLLINELNSKGKLSYVEENQLNDLQDATKELERQLAIKQLEEQTAAEDLYKTNKEAYELESNGGPLTPENIKARADQGPGIDLLAKGNALDKSAAIYQLNEYLNDPELQDSKEYYEDLLADTKKALVEDLSTYQDYQSNITALQASHPLTEEQQQLSAQLESDIHSIFQTLGESDIWNDLQLNDLIRSGDFKSDNAEIIARIQEGSFTESDLQDYTQLNAALEESNLLLENGQSASKLYLDRMTQIANTPFDISSENSIQAIDDFQNRLSVLHSALQNTDDPDSMMEAMKQFPELQEETGDLSAAIQDLIQNELQELYARLGENIPPNILELFDDMAEKAAITSDTFNSVSDALDHMSTAYQSVADITSAYDETGLITQDSLKAISALGGEYEKLTIQYMAGGFTDSYYLEHLNEVYNTDLENYRLYLLEKYGADEPFWNTLMENNSSFIDSMNENYGIDLSNCRSYNMAKLQIEAQTLGSVSSMWSKYYNAESGTMTDEYTRLKDKLEEMGAQGLSHTKIYQLTQKEYDKAKAIKEQADIHKKAMQELEDITYSNIDASFKKLDTGASKASQSVSNLTDHVDSLTDSLENQKSALEQVKSRYEQVSSAVSWFYDQKIQAEQNSIDSLEKQNEQLEKQQSVYDSVLKAVEAVYDKEIESLQAQQDAIQDKIDALRDANDEQERQTALEKAQYALEQAQMQRSKYLFNGREFVYETDKEAITSARDSFDDARLEIKTSELEKEKESLQSSIDQLEKYKSMWGDLSSTYEISQNDLLAKMVLGNEYQNMVLQNRTADVEAFKDNYISIQTQINDNQGLIDSYNEKIAYYESLKSQWEELTGQYQAQQNIQLLMETFGTDYEKLLLDGRTMAWDAFAESYLGVQIEIDEISAKIETAMDNAASTAETAADRLTAAYNRLAAQAGITFNIKGAKIPPGAALYHSGIKKGRVGERLLSDQETLNTLYTHATGDPIHSDELLAKLKVGEVVLTKDQQQRTAASLWNYDRFTEMSRSLVLSSFSADSVPSLPSYLTNNANRNMDFTQNIRIELPNVKTGTDANQIINQLSNLSLKANQYFNRR